MAQYPYAIGLMGMEACQAAAEGGTLPPNVEAPVELVTKDVADKAMRAHVGRTVRRMRDVTGVPEGIAAGRVDVVGAVYDLDTGRVDLLP